MCLTVIPDLVSESSSEIQTFYFSHASDLKIQRTMTDVKLSSICKPKAPKTLVALWELEQEEAFSLETLIGKFQLFSIERMATAVLQRNITWPKVNFLSDSKRYAPDIES